MKRVGAFVLLATIVLSSCGPPAEEIAQTMVAATAEFSTRVAQQVRETDAARPTNTATATEKAPEVEDDAAAYIERGDSYKDSDEYMKAIAEYDKAIELDPQYAQAYYNRGYTYKELGEHQKAIDDFSRAIEIDPQFAKAYNNRGIVYKELDEHQKAIDDYSRAIEIDPQHAKAYYNRGIAYSELGEYQKEIDEYSRAIELDPGFVNAYFNRGIAYSELGKHQKAVADYSRGIELDPGDAQAYYNRGVVYGALGEQQKAIADYRKVLEITDDPDLTRDAQDALEILEAVSGEILHVPEERTSLILLCYSLHEHYSLFSEHFDAVDTWEPDLDDEDIWAEAWDAMNFAYSAGALLDSVDELPVVGLQTTHIFLEPLKKAYQERVGAFYHLAFYYEERDETKYNEFKTSWDESWRLWEQAWDEWEDIAVAYEFDSNYCSRTSGQPDLAFTQDSNEDLAPEDVMANIESQVSTLRGWQLEDEPERRLMTREELRAYNEENFLADATEEEWDDNARTLVALDLIEPGFDLYQLHFDYHGRILGFYDKDDDVMVVISEQDDLDEIGRVTHAHEYQHVLQFHNNDMEAIGYSEEGWEEDSERAAAIQSVIEGEAQLVERLWQNATFTVEEYESEMELYKEWESPPEAPRWFEDDSHFPYGAGYNFVANVYSVGGWPAVDKLYESPPVSMEMIMHPQKYWDGDEPVTVEPIDLAGALGDGWREFESNVMGEFWTYLILREHIPDHQARFAAAGWGGDSYAVAHNEAADQTTLVINWEWDTASDEKEFTRALRKYNDARFGSMDEAYSSDTQTCWAGEQVSCMFSRDTRTLWVFAPSIEIVDKVTRGIEDNGTLRDNRASIAQDWAWSRQSGPEALTRWWTRGTNE